MVRIVLACLLAVIGLVAPAAAQAIDFADHDSGERNVRVGIAADRAAATPGGQVVIAVVLDHAEGFHSQVRAEDLSVDGLVATRVTLTAEGAGITIRDIQWPEAHPAKVDVGFGPQEIPTYSDQAVIYVLAELAADVGLGPMVLTAKVEWQACNDIYCDPPDEAIRRVTLPIVPLGAVEAATTGGALFAGVDPAGWSRTFTPGAGSGGAGGGLSLWEVISLAVSAVIGGFVLNLTPCVLPVIPIKIMTISSHAGSPGKSLVLGLWMAAGVVAFWVGLGVLAASFTAFLDPSRVFGIWWFTLGIGLLIGVMGVGIMGAFTINLPQQVYMVNPKADSPHGSFLFGVMTAVLGLPCFGFVAGALLAGSATMPAWLILTIFAGLGVGMAFPYLVLSANPKLLDKMPRTGPASELVKQVMGLLLMAAAAYFVGAGVFALIGTEGLPWWGRVLHWWFVALFALAAGGWLLIRTLKITPSAWMRGAMGVVALALAGGGATAAVDQSIKARNDFWVPYTEELFQERLAAGDVVVLDFTAEWCLNCKALEAAVLSRDPVKSLLLGPGAVPMKADVTSTSASGWDKLRELGQTGIPTLAVFGPGLPEPWIRNAYTPDQVAAAIEAARGGAAPGPASGGADPNG